LKSTKVEIFYMQKTLGGGEQVLKSTKVEIFYMQKTKTLQKMKGNLQK